MMLSCQADLRCGITGPDASPRDKSNGFGGIRQPVSSVPVHVCSQ